MFKAIADATESETINTIWLIPSKEESLKIKTLIDKKWCTTPAKKMN